MYPPGSRIKRPRHRDFDVGRSWSSRWSAARDLVEFTIVTSVQVAPSSSTVVPLTKLTPMALILMVVPPVAGPAFGGDLHKRGSNIVNPPGSVADPPTVVTVTSLGPAPPAGVVQVIAVGVATTTLVQGFPPIKTVAEPSRDGNRDLGTACGRT